MKYSSLFRFIYFKIFCVVHAFPAQLWSLLLDKGQSPSFWGHPYGTDELSHQVCFWIPTQGTQVLNESSLIVLLYSRPKGWPPVKTLPNQSVRVLLLPAKQAKLRRHSSVERKRNLLFNHHTIWNKGRFLLQSPFLLKYPKKNNSATLCQARPVLGCTWNFSSHLKVPSLGKQAAAACI